MSAGVSRSEIIPSITAFTHQADNRRDLIPLPGNKPANNQLRAHQRGGRTPKAYLLREQGITWGRTTVP
ncbi:UNVERIFIED_CONTAM: hypothetical protein Slati_4246400 [Sesamum latifolium]|uniref:Uncharacterized protein n=1 Tax=Sesamum latifolium TaxID=2727402 RepID=A0AAW2TCK8_9LAMI